MLNIFIADDDKIIRRGLKTIIEEASGRFTVVGEAPNGRKALETIMQLKPDILIADIKMPIMDGVELVRRINELNLKIKVIVLSGFDDYQYVRETMKCGAVDYILKPVANDVLLELLERIESDIADERKKVEKERLFSETINGNIEALKERFVLDIARGSSPGDKSFAQRLRELGITGATGFMLAVISADGSCCIKYEEHKGSMIANDMLMRFIREMSDSSDKRAEIFAARHNDFVLALFISRDAVMEAVEDDIECFLDRLMEKRDTDKDFTLTIGRGKVFDDLEKANIAYHQAVFALQRRFYEGKNRVISYVPEKCCYNNMNEGKLSHEISSLLNFIEIGDIPGVRKSIAVILDRIKAGNVSPDNFRDLLSGIVLKVFAVSAEFKEIADSHASNDSGIAFHIAKLDTLEEVEEYLKDVFAQIAEEVNLLRKEKSKRVIEIAKEYIHKNYNKNITLKSVADHVFLNPTYLSELFKSETGKNFIDYLIETRISVAKKLLAKPENKIYEVGQQVGYDEPVSFNRAFKKIVGISPAEYRNIVK